MRSDAAPGVSISRSGRREVTSAIIVPAMVASAHRKSIKT